MISNVYSYYLTEYGKKTDNKYRSHDLGELKLHYSKMLKFNSIMPFYKLDTSDDAQKYAIDIKEKAMDLSNIAKDLSDITDLDKMCFKKLAESSNENFVDVTYVGAQDVEKSSFQINMERLATPQINQGDFLPADSKLLSPGNYSFDLKISGVTYQFEIVTKSDEKMKDVQEKIVRLINKSKIGLSACCIEDERGHCAIFIESENTGQIVQQTPDQTIFQIQDIQGEAAQAHKKYDTPGIVNILGLNKVVQYSQNAVFSIDGKSLSSQTNSYVYKGSYHLNFYKINDMSEPVIIRLKEDSDAIIQSLSEFADKINQIIRLTKDEDHHKFQGNERLKNELVYISQKNGEILKNNGLCLQEDGFIKVADSDIKDIVNRGLTETLFINLSTFKNDVKERAEYIALDPMQYVNNIVVSYPNPLRNFSSTYFVSLYSGMLFTGSI